MDRMILLFLGMSGGSLKRTLDSPSSIVQYSSKVHHQIQRRNDVSRYLQLSIASVLGTYIAKCSVEEWYSGMQASKIYPSPSCSLYLGQLQTCWVSPVLNLLPKAHVQVVPSIWGNCRHAGLQNPGL